MSYRCLYIIYIHTYIYNIYTYIDVLGVLVSMNKFYLFSGCSVPAMLS